MAIALLGAAFLTERPTYLQWTGMSLAILGAILYFYPVDFPQRHTLGILIAFLGNLTNAFSSMLGRDVNRTGRHILLVVTVVSMGTGSLLLLSAGLLLEETPSWT